MPGFELWTSGFGSDHSANRAKPLPTHSFMCNNVKIKRSPI